MALTPQDIRDAPFTTVKRNGYDPEQVETFRSATAAALEEAITKSTAMEAHARAAIARLQETSDKQAAGDPDDTTSSPEGGDVPDDPVTPTVDESETISRTLLLAQRTADTTVAEAEAQAEQRRHDAETEAAELIEAAEAESRRAGEAERVRVEGEVQALLARRDFLESDVEALEAHIATQRERITEVVSQLEGLTNRVPNGLADLRRPQLSAADHGERAVDDDMPDDDDDLDVAALIDEADADADVDVMFDIGGDDDADTPPGGIPVTRDEPSDTLFERPDDS
ncbi:hypothetical protein BH24ACT5_BH24ACT5_15980 [soil metagenome]